MNDELIEIEIPEGWIKKQVIDFVSRIQSGGTPKSDNPHYYNGHISFVTIDDLTSANKYLCKTKKKITTQGLNSSAAWQVPVNSLMYSIYATLGVPRINKIEAATNQAILNIIPNAGVISLEFLYYLFLEKRSSILAHSAHTTQSNLNAKIVKELEFTFPKSTTEQKKIAEILSKVDKAIEQTQSLIAKYGRIKTGLMQDLLTKGIDENGNIRSEETHEFKDSELGRVPMEWEVEKLENILDDIPNSMRSGPFGSALTKSEWVEKGVPYLGIDNVHRENFIQEYKRFVTKKKFNQLKKYSVRSNDVMITIMGTVGRSCVVPNNIGDALSSKHVWTMSFSKKKYMPELICYQLNYSPWILTVFNTESQGGIMQSINSTTLKSLLFPKPDIKEQRIILKKLKLQNSYILVEKNKFNKLQKIKAALMQDLLSGKKRITDLMVNGKL